MKLNNLKVIFLFDFTDVMARPWLDNGYEVWQFDGKHPAGINREGNLVKVGMWFNAGNVFGQAAEIADMVGDGVHMVFGFPECTYLTVTANRWMVHPDDKHLPPELRRPHPNHPNRAQLRREAVALTKLPMHTAAACGCDKWAFENPARGHLSKAFRRPDFVFHPWQLAGYLPDNHVHPLFPDIYPSQDRYPKETGLWHNEGFTPPVKRPLPALVRDNPGFAKLGGKSVRTKEIRACTPQSLALAVYEANKA